jgi:hypothetical protein
MPIVVGTTVVFFLLFLILRTRLTHRCPAWLIRLCYVLLSISFSCIIGLLSVFSFIPWFVALLVVFVAHLLLYWIWLRFLTRIPQGKYRKNSYDDPEEVSFLIRDPKSEKYDSKITYHWTQILVFTLAISTYALLFWGTEHVCITSEPFSVSVRFTRLFYDDPCSGKDTPCFVYLTVGTNGSTSFKAFVHTGKQYSEPIVKISPSPIIQGNGIVFTAQQQPTPAINEYPRYLYTAELTNLTPGTTYYLVAGDKSNDNSWSHEIKFRTIPSNGDFSFVTGGDAGGSNYTREMFKIAASFEPYFAAFGGDLSYDDAYLGCYTRVDTWLEFITQAMVTPAGYSVPLITAIGNHEAGNFNAHIDDVPFYKYYFDTSLNGTFFHEHYLGNLFLMTLDSEIISLPQSQVPWMTTQLSTLPSNIRFTSALYHAPLYPAMAVSTSFSDDVREAWGPVFDRYNLTVGFENHSHTYKRTKLLRDGKEDPTGTLYIGDGAWGVSPYEPGDVWYLASKAKKRNFIQVNVGQTNMTLRSVDDTGQIFDTVTVY